MNVLYITFAAVLLDVITKIIVKGIQLPFGIQFKGMLYGSSIPIIGIF